MKNANGQAVKGLSSSFRLGTQEPHVPGERLAVRTANRNHLLETAAVHNRNNVS